MRPLTRPGATVVQVDGHEVSLPVEVRSATMVAAQFLVPVPAAQRIVDPTGLEVARLPGGRASLALSAVRYADNDLGPYHEIAVALGVRPHDAASGWRPSPTAPVTYIHRLPVNQAYTCAVGRGLWGFPKWVAEISYEQRRGATRSVLVDDGRFVLGLQVGRGAVPLPSGETAMACYSFADGVLRRTPWTTRNRLVRARPGGATVVLGEGDVADELRSLGLPRRAVMSVATGLMTATFGTPEIVGRPTG
jgi:hypothetical protein